MRSAIHLLTPPPPPPGSPSLVVGENTDFVNTNITSIGNLANNIILVPTSIDDTRSVF